MEIVPEVCVGVKVDEVFVLRFSGTTGHFLNARNPNNNNPKPPVHQAHFGTFFKTDPA
jgi:hypothetical protein